MPEQGMDGRYMVKNYVAVVQNARGTRFMVFKTRDERYYLFCPVSPDGCLSTFQFPVKKTDLARPIARALTHRYGNGLL